MFAYCFPCLPERQKREVRVVGAIMAVLNLGLLGFTVWNFLRIVQAADPPSPCWWVSAVGPGWSSGWVPTSACGATFQKR
jgi:hypothetical protein